jgi:hypothetical protein
MSAPPGPWTPYDQFLNQLGRKTLDMNADTFKMALFLSTSNCGDKAHATAKYSDFTNEVPNGNGYATGGVSLGAGVFVNSAGLQTFDVTDGGWTGSGAGFSFRFAVIYDSTDANKRAICFCIADSTPADYTVAPGADLLITIPNLFTLSQG